MKKILTLIAALSLVASLAVGGSIAYLQDTDQAVNTMTLGNVDIDQIELQRADKVPHVHTAEDGDLVPFKHGQPIYPAVPANNAPTDYSAEMNDLFNWGPYVTDPVAGNGLWNDDKLANVVDKFVFVQNTGKSDAYYRTLIAFECPEGMEYSEGWDKEFMMNTNGNSRFDWEEVGYITIDDARYLLMVATYNVVLTPGEISRPSLLQVVMTHRCTNEHMAKLGETYDILVVSQAVQTAGFADAATALNTAFGEVSANSHPWMDGQTGDQLPDNVRPTVIVSNPAELKEALKVPGANIALANDITFTADDMQKVEGRDDDFALAFVGGGNAILNLNGHDIIVENTDTDTTAIFAHNTNLEIIGNGTIHQEGTSDYLLWAKGDSVVNVRGGNFITNPDDCTVFYASGNTAYSTADAFATINVYGGTFTSGHPTENQDNANVMNHGVGRINYYGGTFNWHPENKVDADDAAYINVGSGYKVVENSDGTYTVARDGAQSPAFNTADFEEAIENGEDVVLRNDIDLDSKQMTIDGDNIDIDLNGKKLEASIQLNNGASVTVSGGKLMNENKANSAIQANSGNVVLNDVTIESARHGVRAEGGDVTINGGTYKVVPTAGMTQHAVNISDGSTVTIYDGTFIGPKGTSADSGAAVNVQANSTCIIYGGTFSGGKLNTLSSKGTLTVYGGTFDQDPSAYAPSGYQAVQGADGWWTVSAL